MTSLEEIREILFEDHVVTVKFKGMRGTKGLFSALLPQVPRPGDVVTYRQKHKHGQGEYRLLRVEWIVAGRGEVVVHLEPVDGRRGSDR